MKANFGGGNFFRNKRKIETMNVRLDFANNHNPKQPDFSGDIEITKDCVKYLIEAFKARETEQSKRRQTEGMEIAKLEVGGRVWESRNGDQYFSMWLQEPYKKPEPKPEPPQEVELDDEIPF